MRLVPQSLSMKVLRWVVGIIIRRMFLIIAPPEALVAPRSLYQRPVQAEVLIRQQLSRSASTITLSNSDWSILCSNSRRRFLVGTVGSKLHSIRFMSRNKRNRRFYSSSSQNARSLRTEYGEMSNDAFNSRSGGTDARSTFEYLRSNSGDRRFQSLVRDGLVGSDRDGPSGLAPPGPQTPAWSPVGYVCHA